MNDLSTTVMRPHAMPRRLIGSLALATFLAASTLAAAQTSAPAATQSSEVARKSATSEHPLIKPGDRNCLRDTGSLIPAKKGQCLPVTGRSYSRDELQRTGTQDNARALQMLDPSISVGH